MNPSKMIPSVIRASSSPDITISSSFLWRRSDTGLSSIFWSAKTHSSEKFNLRIPNFCPMGDNGLDLIMMSDKTACTPATILKISVVANVTMQKSGLGRENRGVTA